jgi:hypothetical protein
MKDVEEQYDNMLGFESRIQSLKSEIQNLKSEIQSNEPTRQFSMKVMIMYLNSLISNQIGQLLRVSEFSPLIRAAIGKVVAPNELKFALKKAIEITLSRINRNDSIAKVLVPINQLKKALIKAIDILISSDPTDRSASVLNTAKLFLQEDIQKSDSQGPGDIA